MGYGKKITFSEALVLRALLHDPSTPRFGVELMRITGLKSGTLYPLIADLVDSGLVTVEAETASPSALGRPRRKYVRITDGKIDLVEQEISEITKRLMGES